MTTLKSNLPNPPGFSRGIASCVVLTNRLLSGLWGEPRISGGKVKRGTLRALFQVAARFSEVTWLLSGNQSPGPSLKRGCKIQSPKEIPGDCFLCGPVSFVGCQNSIPRQSPANASGDWLGTGIEAPMEGVRRTLPGFSSRRQRSGAVISQSPGGFPLSRRERSSGDCRKG